MSIKCSVSRSAIDNKIIYEAMALMLFSNKITGPRLLASDSFFASTNILRRLHHLRMIFGASLEL